MKIGIAFSNVMLFGTPDGAEKLARAAEEAGIESLWTVEHVVVPAGYESAYPYSADGRMPGDEQSSIPDPLVWLTYVAACTERLRLGTGILILPQRSPVVTAKECATLDVLSNGRLMLGVGVGWLREEFEAIGVPFERRGKRTDEAIEALRALWSDDETYRGEFYSFENARSYPKPVQADGIPVVVGGHTMAAARRAGRLGDGFFPARGDLPALFDECRRAAKDAGRDPDAIELSAGGAPTVDEAKRLADLGVTRLIVPPPTFDPNDCQRAFGELSANLISKVP